MDNDPIQTPRLRQVLAAARRAAVTRGHDYLGVEHLMLAILDDGASVAARAVENTGTSLKVVRAELDAIMDSAGYRGAATRDQ